MSVATPARPHIKARNENLRQYLQNKVDQNRLRWQYLRGNSKNGTHLQRDKIGCIVTFVEPNIFGKPVTYVGISKVNTKAGDKFTLDVGLVKAIDHAVPAEVFLEMYQQNPNFLPRVPLSWRNKRDEHGYIVEGEVVWYDQYEDFVERLRRMLA